MPTMPICELDLRPGGRYRNGWSPEAGTEGEPFGFDGEVLLVDPPFRAVMTEHMTDTDYPSTVNDLTLIEEDGATLMTLLVEYPSAEVRDGLAYTWRCAQVCLPVGISIVPLEPRRQRIMIGVNNAVPQMTNCVLRQRLVMPLLLAHAWCLKVIELGEPSAHSMYQRRSSKRTGLSAPYFRSMISCAPPMRASI